MLQSIKLTKRKIAKIKVFFWQRIVPETFQSMIDIIKKFSATIKYLKFEASTELSDFLEILSSVPNAEHLVFGYIRTPNQPIQKKRRVMTNYKELNLHQLKTLALVNCNDEFVILFNKLPTGVLTEFTLENGSLDELKLLFTKQTNIKKITMKFDRTLQTSMLPINIFDNLKLEYLELDLHSYNCRAIEIIMSKQTKLQSLKLIDGALGEDLMNVIANQLTELKTFSMYVPDTPVAAFKNIKKLKNLRDVTLESNEDRHVTHFEAFAALDNSRITTLNIQYVYDVSNDLIAALAKSVPNLKVLRFNCDYNFRIFNETMKCFNFVEILELDTLATDFDYYVYDDDDGSTLMNGDFVNPNLIDLQITYTLTFERPFIKKLIKSYPKLKKLVVRSSNPITVSQLKLLLNGFKKIESLTLIQGASCLRLEDLDVLREHKNHLKFIWLMDMDGFMYNARIKKNLCKMFDVVKCSDNYGLKMAVDRATMQTEGQD